MTVFRPKLAILSAPQRALWPSLAEVPGGFVLYGGTALALRLGHRRSVDFDFFGSEPIDLDRLAASIPFLADAVLLEHRVNTLAVSVRPVEGARAVKVSFFGGLDLRVIDTPSRAGASGILIASLPDLAGTKAKALHDRIELKDYRDIAALLKAGMTLPEIAACAVTVFAGRVDWAATMSAMTYFGEPAMRAFPESLKQTLRRAGLGATPVRQPAARYRSIAASATAGGR